jgi:hypothetical protein
VAFAKLYDRKTPLTAADLMVVPFFDGHGIVVSRVLTDRGTEFCSNVPRSGRSRFGRPLAAEEPAAYLCSPALAATNLRRGRKALVASAITRSASWK